MKKVEKNITAQDNFCKPLEAHGSTDGVTLIVADC